MRSDAGGESITKVVAHLCQWLKVQLNITHAKTNAQVPPADVGGVMQILAGEIERVHKGFLITYHAGPMSSRGGGTYKIMLDRDARIILDDPIPALDSDTFAMRWKF